jgi:hypothetical protein
VSTTTRFVDVIMETLNVRLQWHPETLLPLRVFEVPRGQPLRVESSDPSQQRSGMTPTVLRDGPFRLFFFSREESRMHVHVSHPDGEAKFWLTPDVELATQTGLAVHVVNEAKQLVEDHLQEIVDAWNKHFPG